MFEMSNLTKTLILVVVIVLILYFINFRSKPYCKTCHNNIEESFSSNEIPNEDEKLDKTYKHSSYSEGQRGGPPTSDLDLAFEDNLAVDFSANDTFQPLDEGGCGEINACGEMAAVDHTDEKIIVDDLFNADNYLPQISHKDWFDVPPSPVDVKNRHLINVTRPIGVDSVASSKKNASYDIRGNPPCPKFVVSPWMQSSIDPDVNIKGLC